MVVFDFLCENFATLAPSRWVSQFDAFALDNEQARINDLWRKTPVCQVSGNKRCAVSAGAAMTSSTLRREVWPLLRRIADFASPSRSATNAISAALALPSTGAAARRIFSASPWIPATSVLFAPGWMCSVSRVHPSHSRSHSTLISVKVAPATH